ncbi:MAG: TIGR03915 family putative DNA repair protein, partial [Kiritimatiellia bacterium]|nr:TIGR03915 family putative DNA repair protein [Kiritimatiellia bacterium]
PRRPRPPFHRESVNLTSSPPMSDSMRFRHDGSTDSILAALAAALRAGSAAVLLAPDSSPSLFADDAVRIPADPAAASQLLARVSRELGKDWVRRLFRLLCSEEPDAENVACRVLALAFERGADVMGYQADPWIRKAGDIERRVGGEIHRLKGLLRFRRLADGRLWGPVEPRHNVIVLLAPHFRRRLGGERWLIHDAARGFGIGAELGGPARPWTGLEIEEALRGGLDGSEAEYSRFWQTYFQSIAIRNRSNPEAQRRNMPVRYWKHLIESPGRET